MSKTSTLNKKKPATSKVFLVGTPKNQMLNPPPQKNLYFDNLPSSLVTHMHHATWRFYGIPFPEAQWFGLGNPKHQLAETHVLAPLKTKECLLKSDYNYFHRTYIYFVPFIFREDILVFPFFFVSERFSSDRGCTIHSEGGSKSLFHFDLDRHQSSATVPPVFILGKVQIMHQHQKLQAIFWFVFFSPYKNPHPFFVDLLIYSLSSSKLCQVETASSRRSCKA